MKTAIIDVGSNSVRYAVLTPETTVAKKELCGTVLADGLFFSGELRADAIARTVDAVARFCEKAKADGADAIKVFATEAVRAARNGKTFTDAVLARTGIAVDVIDGVTEARIGFVGAQPDRNKTVTVFDIGGASCEIICGRGEEIAFAKSCPIGCVRLRDGADGKRDEAERLIAQSLPSCVPETDDIVGIGGTATALGGMLFCPDCYDPLRVHNAIVPAEFLRQVADEFFAGTDMQAKYPSLSPSRARIIGYGALAAAHVLMLCNKTAFTVSERDNIEGYMAVIG